MYRHFSAYLLLIVIFCQNAIANPLFERPPFDEAQSTPFPATTKTRDTVRPVQYDAKRPLEVVEARFFADQVDPLSEGATVQAVAETQSVKGPKDLTGYWRNGADRILYFTHEGSSLKSRYTKQATDFVHYANEIDFSTAVLGDLIYGARLTRLSWAKHKKCPVDIYVGIGLTANESYTKLTGFRGDRKVNLANCRIDGNGTVPIVYTRMLDADGNPAR